MSTIGGVSSMAGMMPQIVSGASMRMPPAQKMANLFQQIDTGNTGSISKTQFEQAFQTLNPPPAIKSMGADAVFSKLAPNGTGSVSRQDFINGMKSIMTNNHHHHGSAPAAQKDPAQETAAVQTLTSSINAMTALGNPSAPVPAGLTGSNINTSA